MGYFLWWLTRCHADPVWRELTGTDVASSSGFHVLSWNLMGLP